MEFLHDSHVNFSFSKSKKKKKKKEAFRLIFTNFFFFLKLTPIRTHLAIQIFTYAIIHGTRFNSTAHSRRSRFVRGSNTSPDISTFAYWLEQYPASSSRCETPCIRAINGREFHQPLIRTLEHSALWARQFKHSYFDSKVKLF